MRRTFPSRFTLNSKSWINRHVNDPYVKKSQMDDLRSRSAYKLQEIQDKYHFIKPLSNVLDLGAAPGGWSLVVSRIFAEYLQNNSKQSVSVETGARKVRKLGKLIAVDLVPLDPIDHAIIYKGNFKNPRTQWIIQQYLTMEREITTQGNLPVISPAASSFDVILSDMLQNVTGQGDIDHLKSIELCQEVLTFSKNVLGKDGYLLCKFLQGKDDKELMNEAKQLFQEIKIIKPKSSRPESKEMYLFGIKRKQIIPEEEVQ
jgi:23S rRNA U2552 (ribose-2'-O)-methylase RlmE/FtsJ